MATPLNKKAGSSIYIEIQVRDARQDPSVLIDPTTPPLITFIKPDGTQTTPISMIRNSLGVFSYVLQTLTTDQVGMWQSTVTATLDGYTDILIPFNTFLLS